MIFQTSLLMDHKVEQALERIKAFEPPEGYYVAFSGGKDSIVVKDLVIKAGVKADFHMNMTSIDPPELVRYVKKMHPDVTRHKPAMSMWKLIEQKMMPPTRRVRYCCEVLKEGGGEGRFVMTGIRWDESNKRRSRKMVEGCIKNKTIRYIHPIIDWSDDEVWEYISLHNLPYCSLYDEGFNRIGCIGCPMARLGRRKELKRWPRHEKMYRRAFQKAVENRISNGRNNYDGKHLGWSNGDAMFEWWMDDSNHGKLDEAQCVLFE